MFKAMSKLDTLGLAKRQLGSILVSSIASVAFECTNRILRD
jgi:hypothetical protein